MILNTIMLHERQIRIHNTCHIIQSVHSSRKSKLAQSDKKLVRIWLGKEKGDGRERNYKRVHGNFCWWQVYSLIFTAVMLSWCAYISKPNKTVHINYVQVIVYQLYSSKKTVQKNLSEDFFQIPPPQWKSHSPWPWVFPHMLTGYVNKERP